MIETKELCTITDNYGISGMTNKISANLIAIMSEKDAAIGANENEIKSLRENIKRIEHKLDTPNDLVRGYRLLQQVKSNVGDYKGPVRLKANKDSGKMEWRGESKSIFRNKEKLFKFFHGDRHLQEINQATKRLRPEFDKLGYGKPAVVDVNGIDEVISSRVHIYEGAKTQVFNLTNQIDFLKQEKKSKNHEVRKLEKARDSIAQTINSTRKGLTAIYGTNVGAREINNRIRQQFGLKLKTPLASAVSTKNQASAEWNRSHKDVHFVMATSESLNHAVDALEEGVDTVLQCMFDGQKQESGTQYRGTMYTPGEGIGAMKKGDQFEIGFIMSCDTTEKMANKYASRKYHSPDDPANKNQLPAKYIINGKPFNIGAGDTGEDERNYKPGTQFVLKKAPYTSGGATCFELKEAARSKEKVETIYR